DAARELELARTVGRDITRADLGRLDRAVTDEVAARDEVDDVRVDRVRARHPAGAGDDARVEQVADRVLVARVGTAEDLRADEPLDEGRGLREVGVRRGLDLGRRERRLGTLEVDLTVAGNADDDDLALATRVREGKDDVLERVRGRPRAAVLPRVRRVEE